MGRGLKVQKREYQEVYIGVVGHRNRHDDDSNRIRKRKVPNRYIRPPDQVNGDVKLIFLNRHRVDRKKEKENLKLEDMESLKHWCE